MGVRGSSWDGRPCRSHLSSSLSSDRNLGSRSLVLDLFDGALLCHLRLQLRIGRGTHVVRFSIEVLCDFLHGDVSRLHHKEVQEPDLEPEEAAVEDVVLPVEGTHGDGVDELVEEDGSHGDQAADHGGFGAQAVGHDFGGVGQGKTGPVFYLSQLEFHPQSATVDSRVVQLT